MRLEGEMQEKALALWNFPKRQEELSHVSGRV